MCAAMVGVLILGIGIGLVLGMHGGHEGRHGRGEYQGRYGDSGTRNGMYYQGSVMRINPPVSGEEDRSGVQAAPTAGAAVGFEVTSTTTRK